MASSRQPFSWITVLYDTRVEERVATARCVLVLLVGAIAASSYLTGALVGLPALVLLVLLSISFVAVLVPLSMRRAMRPETAQRYGAVSGAIDVVTMAGGLVASAHGSNELLPFSILLVLVMLLGASGFRLQWRGAAAIALLAISFMLCVALMLIMGWLPSKVLSLGQVLMTGVSCMVLGVFTAAVAHRAEGELTQFHEAQRIHARLMNHVSDGFLVCDISGRVVDSNASASGVLGIPKRVLVGVELFVALPQALGEELRLAWEEMLVSGMVVLPAVRFSKGTQSVVVDVTAYRLTFGGEQFVHVLLRDMTVVSQLVDLELQRYNVDRMRLSWNHVVQEFDQSFASMEASYSKLTCAMVDDEAVQGELSVLGGALARGTRLLRLLRDVTDVDEPQRVPTDVMSVVQQALTHVQVPASVHVSTVIEPELMRVLGDSEQLVRMLVAVLKMATGAMLDGGMLTVWAKNLTLDHGTEALDQGDYVQISIEDTGLGMPSDMAVRVIELTPMATGFSGYGSGLSLGDVHVMVRRYGGSFEVQSDVGSGARYTLQLPATMEPVVASNPVELSFEWSRRMGKGYRLLIVDDETSTCRSLQRIFLSFGYAVDIVQEADAQLDWHEKVSGPFDVVLVGIGAEAWEHSLVREKLKTQAVVRREMMIPDERDTHGVGLSVADPISEKRFSPLGLSQLIRDVAKECREARLAQQWNE